MGIHAPLARLRPVVLVRPLPLLVPAPVGRAVLFGLPGQDVPPRPVVRVLPLRPVVLRHLLGGSRRRSVPVRPEGRAVPVDLADPLSPEARPGLDPVAPAGLVDVPAAPGAVAPVVLAAAVQEVQEVQVDPEALAAAVQEVREAPVDLAVPAVGSLPASPARTSRPHRRPPQQRPPHPRGDAAAP